MKKRILSFLMAVAMLLSFACNIVPGVKAAEALPSYSAYDDFSTEVFSYGTRNVGNGEMGVMGANADGSMYINGDNCITAAWISTGSNPAVCSVLTFTAPYAGTITINPNSIINRGQYYDLTNFAASYAQIYHNSFANGIASYSIPANGTPVAPEALANIQVAAGDQIMFMVGSNSPLNSYIEWMPTVVYTEATHIHSWAAGWTSEGTAHWHECTASGCNIENNAEKDGYAEHADVNLDFACDVCGAACTLSYSTYDGFSTDVFSYRTRNVANGEMGAMVTNADGSMYINGGNYITAAWISTGVDPAVCSVVTFTAPYAGTITINPNSIINRGQYWDCTNFAASYAQIYHNSFANGIAAYNLPANGTPVVAEALTNIEVAAGDQIMFMVGSNSTLNSYVEWMPTIAYTSVVGGVHNHEWSSEWSTNEAYHWHECTASGCNIENNAEKDGYAEHADVNLDFACDVCGAARTPSYNAYDDFSTDVFSYRTRNLVNGEMGAMVTSADGSMYIGGGNYISSAWISTGLDPAVCSVVTFTAPYAGTITINSNTIFNRGQYWDCTNFAESYAQIYHNSFANGIAAYSIPANGTPVVPEALENIEVAAGDQIMFMVGSNSTLNTYIEWMPTITYISMGESAPAVEVTTEELLKPIWTGTKVYNESVMVIKNADGTIDPIQLMYPVESIDYVCDSSLRKIYQENIDYKIENGKLVILPSGSIPMTAYDEYYLKNEIPGNSFPAAQGGYLYFAEGSVFHEKQIAVTYSHSGTWQGGIPEGQAHKLPNTLEKLQNKEPLKIVFYGDSITVGANSSSFVQAKPYLPTWTELVTNALKTKYAYNDITAENTALGGAGIAWGLDNVAALVTAKNPDLVFIGFGMNDNTDNATYKLYISAMISAVRRSNPDCEFVLMGTMLPNSEVQQFASSNHINYVRALDEIAQTKTGIAVADVTTVHSDLLNTKRYFDMTGNNVNHPNDFLARVYAQVAMQVFESVSGGVHEHQWSLSWQFDENFHWHECTASGCDIENNAENDGYAEHTDVNLDFVCDVCGACALSYSAYDDFSTDVFSYRTRNVANGEMGTMVTNADGSMYIGGDNCITTAWISTGSNPAVCSVVTFTAPYAGTITINPNSIINRGQYWDCTNYAASYAQIYHNSFANDIAAYNLPANDTPVVAEALTNIEVAAGDQIMFMVGSNSTLNSYIEWMPTVVYTEIAHIHSWAEGWTSDGTHHWHECAASGCDIENNAEKDGYAEHVDVNLDFACDVCGGACTLSYNASEDFGTDVFSYSIRNVGNGAVEGMSWNTTHSMYIYSDNYISNGYISTGSNPAVCSVLTFTAPYTGTITINSNGIVNRGEGWSSNYFAAYAQVLYPDWGTGVASYDIPATDAQTVATPEITLNVTRGQQIRFMVGSNVAGHNGYIEWKPVITYTEVVHGHNWEAQWNADATTHWHECYAGCPATDNRDKKDYGCHIDDNGDLACDVCGYANADVVFEAREAVTYYVSNSTGNDSNDGLSPETAWKTVEKVAQTRLLAGDTVLFKAGDVWYGSWELDLSRGTERDPITFASYGDGAKPDFRLYNGTVVEKTAGICMKLINANGFVMSGLSVGYANLGVELVYESAYYESEYVRFEDCHFHDIYGVTQLDNVEGLYLSAGISTTLENNEYNGDAQGNNWPLRSLYIDGCTTNDAGSLVSGPNGVYGFYMTDCVVENNGYYGTTVYGCFTGYIDGCIFRNNGTRPMPAGSCGIMMSVSNFTVKNTVVIGQQRQGDDPDGCGIDFEAYCRNVTIENCLFQDNAGVGVFYFTSGTGAQGTNHNTDILNCYFINNNKNSDGDIPKYDVFATYYGASGCTVSGNKYYYSYFNGSRTQGFALAWDNNDWTLSNNTRIYSIPADLQNLILKGGIVTAVDRYNVSLGDDLNLNFYLNVSDYAASKTVVNVTVLGNQTSYQVGQLTQNADGLYVLTVELAAAQMTEDVAIQIVYDGAEVSNKTYSVRDYANYIMDDANGYSAETKALVEAMLHYGASAQQYFDINVDDLANAGYTDTVTEELPDVSGYTISAGSIEGINFYGASLLFKDKIAVRFYFAVNGTGTYTVNGKNLTQKGDLWYVDFEDIAPQDLSDMIEVTVSNGEGDSFTVSYSPVHYIVRQYNKTENAELKELVQDLYDYHKAALAYVA